MKDTKKLLTIENESESVGTIFLYGVIGHGYDNEDISDIDFLQTLTAFSQKYSRIDIRGNCFGGSMKHGLAIITAIQTAQSKGTDIHIYNDGIMASMAADIFMAVKGAGNRHAAANSSLMIHNPIDGLYGNAKYLRDNVEKVAQRLDKLAEGTIAIMAEATGLSEEDVKNRFYADYEDHYLTAKEMLEIGLIAKIEDYASQNVPKEPQKMSIKDIVNWFSTNKQTDIQTNISITNNQSDEMTTEDIEKIADAVNAKMTPAAPAPAAPAPAEPQKADIDVAKIVSDAVKTAIEPLQAEIEVLKTAKQGASTLPSTFDVNKPSDLEALKAAFEQEQNEYAKAVTPFSRSY